jgi:hypothetical protein
MFLIRTVECGTSHKYTNVHNIYLVNTTKILQRNIIDHFYTQQIHLQSKMSVYFSFC